MDTVGARSRSATRRADEAEPNTDADSCFLCAFVAATASSTLSTLTSATMGPNHSVVVDSSRARAVFDVAENDRTGGPHRTDDAAEMLFVRRKQDLTDVDAGAQLLRFAHDAIAHRGKHMLVHIGALDGNAHLPGV
jgi:hypothetical protein